MKHSLAFISTLLMVLFLVTFSHAIPPKQNGLQHATKAQVNAMQKQLVKKCQGSNENHKKRPEDE
jgi:hypothetical protein